MFILNIVSKAMTIENRYKNIRRENKFQISNKEEVFTRLFYSLIFKCISQMMILENVDVCKLTSGNGRN